MSLVITLQPPSQSSFPPSVFVADVKNYYKITIYIYTPLMEKLSEWKFFFIRSFPILFNIVSYPRCLILISIDCYNNDRFIQIGYNLYK